MFVLGEIAFVLSAVLLLHIVVSVPLVLVVILSVVFVVMLIGIGVSEGVVPLTFFPEVQWFIRVAHDIRFPHTVGVLSLHLL